MVRPAPRSSGSSDAIQISVTCSDSISPHLISTDITARLMRSQIHKDFTSICLPKIHRDVVNALNSYLGNAIHHNTDHRNRLVSHRTILNKIRHSSKTKSTVNTEHQGLVVMDCMLLCGQDKRLCSGDQILRIGDTDLLGMNSEQVAQVRWYSFGNGSYLL